MTNTALRLDIASSSSIVVLGPLRGSPALFFGLIMSKATGSGVRVLPAAATWLLVRLAAGALRALKVLVEVLQVVFKRFFLAVVKALDLGVLTTFLVFADSSWLNLLRLDFQLLSASVLFDDMRAFN